MATNPKRLQAAQAYVAQNPHCCLLDLEAHLEAHGLGCEAPFGLDEASDLRGNCTYECDDSDDGCPYARPRA